jgi:soluble lytic murein transglycosylase-like protein
MNRLLLAAMWVAVLAVPVTARADIFTYTDAEGVVHFTNAPVNGAKAYEPNADALGFGGQAEVRYANTPRMWTPASVKNDKAARYQDLMNRAARRYRLPVALVKAVTAAESGFNPAAQSHAGACGLMQLMPGTAAEMQVKDIFDPEQNVMGGARYLRYLINHFDGDVKLAVAAYNAGPNIVSKVKRVPNIPETKGYVKRVLSLYRGYRQQERVALR